MATLFLHIGQHKTGTSAIQTFMAANRNVLRSKGYHYPNFNIRFEGASLIRNAHFLIHQQKDEKGNRLYEKEDAIVDKCLEKIVKMSKKYPNIVLSDERVWFGAADKERFWEKLKAWASVNDIELKVIIFIRRQDYFIQSFWAQSVKETSSVSFHNYIYKKKYKMELNYDAFLTPIAEIIGQSNLTVKVYDKTVHVISAFLEAINLKLTDEYRRANELRNPSLIGKYLEIKRLLNHLPEYKEKHSFVVPLLNRVQEEEGKSGHLNGTFYFTPEEQKEFMAQFEESNKAVAQKFLDKPDGNLFIEESKKSEDLKNIEYSVNDLISICGKVCALQQEKIIDLQNQLEKKFEKLSLGTLISIYFFKIKKRIKKRFKKKNQVKKKV